MAAVLHACVEPVGQAIGRRSVHRPVGPVLLRRHAGGGRFSPSAAAFRPAASSGRRCRGSPTCRTASCWPRPTASAISRSPTRSPAAAAHCWPASAASSCSATASHRSASRHGGRGRSVCSMLAGHGASAQVIVALGVAVTIGIYSVVDAKGHPHHRHAPLRRGLVRVRDADDDDLCAGDPPPTVMVAAVRIHWRRFVMMGIASGITYALVQIAFQQAPVGYVTCLRESSVVIAAFVGARYLGEGQVEAARQPRPRRGRRVVAAGDRPMSDRRT